MQKGIKHYIFLIFSLGLILLCGCSKEIIVSFDSDGGSIIESQNVTETGKVSKPEDPEKSGYIFSCWQLNGTEFNFDNKVEESITLKAKWIEGVELLFSGAGIEDFTLLAPKGVEFELPIPEREGYRFVAWADEEENEYKDKGTFDSHLLFYGPAGTGKSSTVRVILNELGISDYLVINGSDKTGIDDTRRIIEYASVPALDDKIKVVVMEEFERLSPQAQDSLKYVLEKYSGWCRFIFTTNNINKVTTPIISRCEVFCYSNLDVGSYLNKVIQILKEENIENNPDDIADYINASYPDLRKCINLINQNVVDGKLNKLNKDDALTLDKYQTIFNFIQGKADVLTTQKMLATSINNDEFEGVYKMLYNNLSYLTQDRNRWEFILVKIADYLFKNNTVAFKDLNFMACLVEIKNIVLK